jgi:uncharacterized protein YndB with AHSA1/START domain
VKWWGPKGFTTPKFDVELRAGGAFRFTMRGPDGNDYPFDGRFVEVRAPERIVFDGRIHDDVDSRTEVMFTEKDGKTTITLRQTYTRESDATRGAPVGWSESLDKLEELLAKQGSS